MADDRPVRMFVCLLCRDAHPDRRPFQVPADKVGVAIMKGHLQDHTRTATTAATGTTEER
jgi:hypothetical protein